MTDRMKIEDAVWEASIHVNTAYGLMTAFWEDYISHTDSDALEYDMHNRRHVVEAKISAALTAITSTKAELDVYIDPNSGVIRSILESADRMREKIAVSNK